MEEELRAGTFDCGGVAAGGALDEGVGYLDVVGADVVDVGVAPREGGADCRGVHDDVRPAELLVLRQTCWRCCTSRSALQAR